MGASSWMVEKGWEGEMGSEEQQDAQGPPATSPMFKKHRQSTSETSTSQTPESVLQP